MSFDDAVGQELAKAGLRPAVDDELRDGVQVGARVDLLRDAGAEDREDRRGALAAEIALDEEPVLPAEDEGSQLALDAVVRELDAAVRRGTASSGSIGEGGSQAPGRAASSAGRRRTAR